jgi:hypothetical protein
VTNVARFPYHFHGEQALMPYIPVTLEANNKSVPSAALLDSGASINVVPQFIGHQLGLDWDAYQDFPVRLGGAFRGVEARYASAEILIGHLNSQKIAFAWTTTDEVPFVLGNANFFQVFDVCFSRSSNEITIRVARAHG